MTPRSSRTTRSRSTSLARRISARLAIVAALLACVPASADAVPRPLGTTTPPGLLAGATTQPVLGARADSASGPLTPRYPDLRALPPSELQYGADASAPRDFLLRFSTAIWNAGEGPL